MANRLNRLRNRSTGCPRPVKDRSRDAKKFSLSQWASLPGQGDSLPGRGLVEATVTCHALNAPTASEPVDP